MRSACLGVVLALAAGSAASAATVYVDQSTAPWLGFMNVFELPSTGGGFVFANPWGVADLRATFNDVASELTLSPNSVNDASSFWYTPSGGPGSQGNKIMEANLYQEVIGGLSGQTVVFQGNVLSNSFTSAHIARIFIRDFPADFSSVNETIVPLTPGPFSISLNTLPGANRIVQWGFQVRGVNVWSTDVAPFGTAVIQTIPAPAAAGVLGLAGVCAARRRRSR